MIGDLVNLSVTVGGFDLMKTAGVSIVELNIYEDMESPTGTFGDIHIIDGVDFVGTNSITGNELVFVSFTSDDFPIVPFNYTYFLLMQGTNVKIRIITGNGWSWWRKFIS